MSEPKRVELTEAEREYLWGAYVDDSFPALQRAAETIVAAREAAARRGALLEAAEVRVDEFGRAREAIIRQNDLPSLMHFDRPSDFKKGVLSALTAFDAALAEPERDEEGGR